MSVLVKGTQVGDTRVDKAIDQLRSIIPATTLFDRARIKPSVKFTDLVVMRIPHSLGRRLQGYLIVGIRGNDALGYFDDENDGRHPDMDKFAYIRAVGFNPVADVMFF